MYSISFLFCFGNGEPHGLFHPHRGLQQGDPLSPYLFLLWAEGLHSLIQQAETNGSIHGVSLCKNDPKVSHLFFAYDSLLFCHANDHDCKSVMDVIGIYELASGQLINGDKTQVFFSSNTTQETEENIKGVLGVSVISQYEKYLGLPSFVS